MRRAPHLLAMLALVGCVTSGPAALLPDPMPSTWVPLAAYPSACASAMLRIDDVLDARTRERMGRYHIAATDPATRDYSVWLGWHQGVPFTVVFSWYAGQSRCWSEVGFGASYDTLMALQASGSEWMMVEPTHGDPTVAPLLPRYPEDGRPRFLGYREPEYPQVMADRRRSGRVVVRLVIDTLGLVDERSVQVVTSTNILFEPVSVAALRSARFRPAEVDGRKVPVQILQTLSYSGVCPPPTFRDLTRPGRSP